MAEYIPNPIVKLSKNGCIIKEDGKTVHIKAANPFGSIDIDEETLRNYYKSFQSGR